MPAPPFSSTRVSSQVGSELFLNPLTAARAEQAVRSDPSLRPRVGLRPEPGSLRRSPPAPRSGLSPAPGEWTGSDPSAPRPSGFENGRVLIEVGLDGPATVEIGFTPAG